MWKLFAIGNHTGQFGVGADLAVDFGLAPHALNARASAQRGHFQHEGVAGDYGPAKSRLFDPGEQHQLLITIFNFAQSKNGSALRHRFDHQDARHYRRSREVTLKVRLVDADLLDANYTLARN